MIQIMREFNFNIAHQTEKNLHGHSYRLNLIATGVLYTGEKKVVNFDDFVEFVEKCIISKLSNSFLYNKYTDDVCESEIAKILTQNGRKVVTLEFVPTTEKLADYIFNTLNFECIMQDKDFRISKLELFESQSCSAIVKG